VRGGNWDTGVTIECKINKSFIAHFNITSTYTQQPNVKVKLF